MARIMRYVGYSRTFKCDRCDHEWVPHSDNEEPRVCPKCKSPYWDVPRGTNPRGRPRAVSYGSGVILDDGNTSFPGDPGHGAFGAVTGSQPSIFRGHIQDHAQGATFGIIIDERTLSWTSDPPEHDIRDAIEAYFTCGGPPGSGRWFRVFPGGRVTRTQR